MKKKKSVIVGTLVAGVMVLLFTMGALSQRKPKMIGATAGKLADCPNRPNCVSSQASSTSQRIAPLAFGDPANLAWDRLRSAVASMPGTSIVADEDGYMHVEFRSRVFCFVDDVEFLMNSAANQIEVRSASRIGYSDLRANRKRVESIRMRFSDLNPLADRD